MEDLVESILDYVRADYTDYAIMINGEWGSGKTYFWNNKVRSKIESNDINGKRYHTIYMSLYGISNLDDISKKILKVTLYLIILSLVVLGIYLGKEIKILTFIGNILSVATPFFIGIVIAWLLDPIVTWLSKKKVNRTIGSSFVFLVFIVLLYLFFRLIVPMLYT